MQDSRLPTLSQLWHPAEFQIQCLDNPNASGVETRPLDFMDQGSSVREAKLIVAPIAMAAPAVGDVERLSEHTGIAQLNASIVIGTRAAHSRTSFVACRRLPRKLPTNRKFRAIRHADSDGP